MSERCIASVMLPNNEDSPNTMLNPNTWHVAFKARIELTHLLLRSVSGAVARGHSTLSGVFCFFFELVSFHVPTFDVGKSHQ